MSGTVLSGEPIVRLTVTGSKTFEAVRITISDGESDNTEISTHNLLFGADANEGSVSSVHTVQEVLIRTVKDMCRDPILSEKIDEPSSSWSAVESRNSLELKIYGDEEDLIFTYKDLWAYGKESCEAPQAGKVLEIASEILKIASDLSGKHYALDSMR